MLADYCVTVRSLCEFTAKSGDLSARFNPSPTAQQGIAGHRIVGARRGARYERELTLQGRYKRLRVRGRADGFDPERGRLEEFKTHRGDLERMPANQRGLHWAQLKIYGALLCAERSLTAVQLVLVYFDIQSEAETCLTESCSAAALQDHFEGHCQRFLAWAVLELEHRDRRDRDLLAMPFPYEQLRSGQRRMAEAVYRAALAERTVMVQAPTGIGKTIGTLYPLLKALPKGGLDKVFFLVAKTPGRRLALDALRRLQSGSAAPRLRVLELAAKDSSCEYPGRSCEAASCPLAQGFYDRLAAAREDAVQCAFLDRETIRRVALSHQLCPYYLGQELARWCDVVVGDYNYYFDTRAILHGLTQQNQWRLGILVDEGHNLLTRGREMYSMALQPQRLDTALAAAPPPVKSRLLAVQRGWQSIHRVQTRDYEVHAEIPAGFVALLRQASAAIADDMARDPTLANEALLHFYFDALHFCRLAEDFADHSLFDVTLTGANAVLCIRNVDPGPFLATRFAAAKTTILFSATLAPKEFYRRLLGLPRDTRWIDVESPFAADQLEVRIEARISTRYRDRALSLRPLAELIARQYHDRPGNYLAFCSSFDYLQAVFELFQARYAEIPAWQQMRGMTGSERDQFLTRFTLESRGIGFAVLGGAFAEGIDLPGGRLIGAFIATLGLPQVNEINAQIERRLETLFGSGYEYTYLYPGLQKVVQAAGRVIRTPTDRGTLYLIDDRYLGARVRTLLPEWWRVQCV